MAAFSAAGLVAAAKKRYGESLLRNKIRGADQVEPDERDAAADIELLEIARGVLEKVETSVQSSIGWPIPGVWPTDSFNSAGDDISGEAFSDIWPFDLLHKALALFYYRVLEMGEVMSEQERRMSVSAEKYFERLEEGAALGVGGPTDASAALVRTIRDRSGRALLGGLEDRQTLIDDMSGPGWDHRG